VFGTQLRGFGIDAQHKRIRTLGEGTYGTVVLARNIATGAVLALKSQGIDSHAAANELAIYLYLRRHPHPNALALQGWWVSEDRPGGDETLHCAFDVMSGTLRSVVQTRCAAFSPHEAKALFGAVARGVAHLHAHGIAHCDLSSRNVLVNSISPADCRICDFGTSCAVAGKPALRAELESTGAGESAHLREPMLLDQGDLITTVTVRAPEVTIEPCLITRAVDCWALGVHAVTLATGTKNVFWRVDGSGMDEVSAHQALNRNINAFLGVPGETAERVEANVRRFLNDGALVEAPLDPRGPAADLIAGLLTRDCPRRVSAEKAASRGLCARARPAPPTGRPAPPTGLGPHLEERDGGEAPPRTSQAGGPCQCSANCGLGSCRRNSRRKRPRPWCPFGAAPGFQFCDDCRCEVEGCPRPRNKSHVPFCADHQRKFAYEDKPGTIANRNGVFQADPRWDRALLLVGRLSALVAGHRYEPPDAREMSETVRVCFPDGKFGAVPFVRAFLAHTIKWPSPMAEFRRLTAGAASGAALARAYREVILFASGKAWPNAYRHVGNSPGVRFQTGLAVSGERFGFLRPAPKASRAAPGAGEAAPGAGEAAPGAGEAAPEPAGETASVTLGPRATPFTLAAPSEDIDALFDLYIRIAAHADLPWPRCAADFADSAEQLMSLTRELRRARSPGGAGLFGGTGTGTEYCVKSFGVYVLDHAWGKLPDPDADVLTMDLVAKWAPDKAGHLAGTAGMKAARVRQIFGGMSPLHLAPWACLLSAGVPAKDLVVATEAAIEVGWRVYDDHRGDRLEATTPPIAPHEEPYCPPTGHDLVAAIVTRARG